MIDIKKRIIFLIVIVSSIIFIYGCKKNSNILSTPTNIYLDEEEILRWDKVENATSYVIHLDNLIFETSDNQYDLFEDLNEYKTYEIKVFARSSEKKYLESNDAKLSYTLEENKLKYELVNNSYVVSVQDPNEIKGKVIIPETYNRKMVAGVKEKAFSNCMNLTKVIIPDSIVKYERRIFSDCTNLVRVKHSDNVTEIPLEMFNGCESLKDAYLPDSVQKIRSDAYRGCNSLKKVFIPDGVEQANNVFNYCINLESISFPESINKKMNPLLGCPNLQVIEMRGNNQIYYTENNCLIEKETKKLIVGCINSIIPSDVTRIGGRAFINRNIETIEIGKNIEIIEEEAFSSCKELKSIKIDGVKEIRKSCFLSCSSLTDFELTNVDIINEKCFMNCSSLTNVNLESVKVLKEEVFNNCINLSEITFSNTLESIKYFNTKGTTNITFKNHDYYTFENECVIDKRTNTLICGTENSIIPNYVKILGEYCFQERKNPIILPEGLEIIDKYAFKNCYFETIKFPRSLKRIESGAFFNSSNLLYVTIPENVEYIGGTAFDVPHCITVIFDGFNGELGKNSFRYNTVYSNLQCDTIFESRWNSEPFRYREYVAYNTVYKEDNGEKYVYSMDLKYLTEAYNSFYAMCYREGYKHIGWSFTENSDEVDIELVEIVVNMTENWEANGTKKFYGFKYALFLEKQKEYGTTILYAVWEKE